MIILIATYRKMKDKPNIYQPPETQYEEWNKAWSCVNWDQATNLTIYLKEQSHVPHSIRATFIEKLETA